MKHKKIVDPEVKRIKFVALQFGWGDITLNSTDLVLRIKQLGIEKANFQASSLALRIIKSLQVNSSWLVLQLKAKVSKDSVINTVIDHYRIKNEIIIGQQMIYKYLQSTTSRQTIVLQSKKQQIQRKSQENSIVKRFLMAKSLQGMFTQHLMYDVVNKVRGLTCYHNWGCG